MLDVITLTAGVFLILFIIANQQRENVEAELQHAESKLQHAVVARQNAEAEARAAKDALEKMRPGAVIEGHGQCEIDTAEATVYPCENEASQTFLDLNTKERASISIFRQ